MRRHVRTALLSLALLSSPALAAPPAAPKAEGKRISLDVVRADLHDVLRMLADQGRLNLVVAEGVQGKVTLRLRDVPWNEVLETVLASHGLGTERRGNVVRVAPLRQLQEEAEARVKLAQARELEAPLHTYFLPVSYARAADLLPQVQALLSPRGRASVDARTNTLIITDVGPVKLP
jgi:type IV pilus assembly protein PilQ